MPAVPKALRRLRILALFLGAAIFVWLPFEDLTPRGYFVFAALICSLSAAWLAFRCRWSTTRAVTALLLGGFAGLAVAPLAVALMVLKSGLHAHPTPDFTLQQVWAVLRLAPVWGMAGLLASLALRLWAAFRADGH